MYNIKIFNLGNGNSVNFTPLNDLFISRVSGLDELGIDLSESQGVNQIGTTIQGESIPSRLIKIEGTIKDKAVLRREQLIRLMPPEASLRIVFNNKLYIDGKPEVTPGIERYAKNSRFQFSVRAPYPYWRYMDQDATALSGMQKMFRFPINYGNPPTHRFGSRIDVAYKNIENVGNVPCPFMVRLHAVTAVTNPRILNIETLEYIGMKKTMVAGEIITMDTRNGGLDITSEVSGVVTDDFKNFDTNSSVPFLLSVGDNLIRYDADSNRTGLNAIVRPAFALSAPFGDDATFN